MFRCLGACVFVWSQPTQLLGGIVLDGSTGVLKGHTGGAFLALVA